MGRRAPARERPGHAAKPRAGAGQPGQPEARRRHATGRAGGTAPGAWRIDRDAQVGILRKPAVEICAPEGNIPMLRGGTVALALARSAWHFSQALAVAWRLYRAPADGVWQGLHRVHRFAAEPKLDTRQVADPLAGNSSELRVIYLRALLMAVTHPLAFSQGEQDLLWQVTADMAMRTAIVRMEPE